MQWSRRMLAGAMLLPATAFAQQPTRPTEVNKGAPGAPGAQPTKMAREEGSPASGMRKMIDEANARAIAAFNSGDIASFAKIYTEDAWLLPPNASALKGRQAITEHWQGGWKMGVRNIKLATLDLRSRGDMAYEVGTYQLDVEPQSGASPGAATMHDHGKYIVIWKRSAGGEWQWYRDCYNSDVAVAAAK